MQNPTLADALLRRKELQGKVDQLRDVKSKDLFEMKVRRQQITDTLDDIKAEVPKCSINEVTSAYDHYARQLRLIDATIQRLNWTTDFSGPDTVWADWKAPTES